MTQRLAYKNPTPEQEAEWANGPVREQPLVWRQRSGRRSLVVGNCYDVIGMDVEEGCACSTTCSSALTRPEIVYRHEWQLGDTIMWDNRGVLHRVA